MGKNLEIIACLIFFILSFGFSIWNFYISSYATAIAMLIIAIVNIGYLVKEIREKRSDGDCNN